MSTEREYQEFQETFKLREMEVEGRTWQVHTGGRGPIDMVLLPGGTGIGSAWFPLSLRLKEDVRLIIPSYPPAQTMADLKSGLFGVLDALCVERCHWLGTSMGGFLLQVVIHENPGRVYKAVLANTIPPDRDYGAPLGSAVSKLRYLPQFLLRAAAGRGMLAHLEGQPQAELDFWKQFTRTAVKERDARAMLATNYACVSDYCLNYEFEAGSVHPGADRLLIIESGRDRAFSQPQRDSLRALYPQAKVHHFENAGHLAYITEREGYARVVRGFIYGGKD